MERSVPIEFRRGKIDAEGEDLVMELPKKRRPGTKDLPKGYELNWL